jgi:thiol-disulfide isomerase/thioredoxin
MKSNQLTRIVALTALGVGLWLNTAAGQELKHGDPAPKLKTGKWLQGEPVKEFEQGKVYLVAFWTTASQPCRLAIPRLNDLHLKFKDKGLVVIGQDCVERDESLVAPFLKGVGDKLTFRVALDDHQGSPKGRMMETWVDASGLKAIPLVFVVDKQGLIAWIGYPMALKEEVIEQVVAGEFDLKAAAAEAEQFKKNVPALNSLKGKLDKSLGAKSWDEALATLSEMEKLLPQDQRENLDMTRVGILLARKDSDAAYKLASKTSDDHQDNAMMQNEIAWMIVTNPTLEKPDLALAEKLATRANTAAREIEPTILDTLARVMFMRDAKDKAIALQEKAVNLAQAEEKAELQKTLESYKKGELPKAN